MTPEEALRGYTSWAAFASFDEARGGQLTAGRRADFTVLSTDPLTAASTQDLLSGTVRFTVSRGRVAFRTTTTP
jgi:predicted amidohydrolase YtcJ